MPEKPQKDSSAGWKAAHVSIIPQQGPYCSGNAGKRLHPGRPPPWAPCCPVFWPIPSSDITAACPTPDPNTVPVSTTALLPAISKSSPPGTPRPSRFRPLPWTSTRRCSRSSASKDAILIPSASALPCACCFPALWMPTILIRNVSAPPTSTGSGQRSPPCRRPSGRLSASQRIPARKPCGPGRTRGRCGRALRQQ